MKKLNLEAKVEHKKKTYAVRKNSLFLGKSKVIKGTRTLAAAVIVAVLALLGNLTEKEVFPKGAKFETVVFNLRHLIGSLDLLVSLKSWSCNAWYRGFIDCYKHAKDSRVGSTLDKFCMEIGEIFNRLTESLYSNAFSWPQKMILYKITDGLRGSMPKSHLTSLYDASKLCRKQLLKELANVKKFDFNKYDIPKRELVSLFEKEVNVVLRAADDFEKLVGVAGDDFVNWGPHKIAAQCKKIGIENSHNFRWGWGDVYCKTLKKKGVKKADPKKRKKSNSETLVEKYDNGDALSQSELVTVFKYIMPVDSHRGYGGSSSVIDKMDVETAVSLLEIETKNVQNKIAVYNKYRDKEWQTEKSFELIYDKVAEKENLDALSTLRSYMSDKDIKHTTWQMLETYAGKLGWLNRDLGNLDSHQMSEKLFDAEFARLNGGKRFTQHSSVTHKFIERMDTEEKTSFCYAVQQNDEWCINWRQSAILLEKVAYKSVKNLITDYTYRSFIDVIEREKDTEKAVEILTDENHSNPDETEHRLYKLLDVDTRFEMIAERKYLDSDDVIKIVGKEKEMFFRFAIQTSLTKYLTDFKITNKRLNELVSMTSCPLVSVSDASKLSQENLMKVFKNGSWIKVDDYTLRLYGRYNGYSGAKLNEGETLAYQALNRDSFLKLFDTQPNDHHMRDHLTGIMSGQEFLESCQSNTFVRQNIDKIETDIVSVRTLVRFKDKDEFKEIVGDQRQKNNRNFANKLKPIVDRLARLDKLKIVK